MSLKPLVELQGWSVQMKVNKLWNLLSEDLQNLLSSMLSMDPDDRPSVTEILEENWLYEGYDWDSTYLIFWEMEQRFNFWK